MRYLTERDLPITEKNTFKVPLFLFGGSYKKVSADAKLLFSMVMEKQSFNSADIEREIGYSPELVNKCIKELTKAGLIQADQLAASNSQSWRKA